MEKEEIEKQLIELKEKKKNIVKIKEIDKETQRLIEETRKMKDMLGCYFEEIIMRELKKDKKIRQIKIVDFSMISLHDDIVYDISGEENRLHIGFDLTVDFDFPITFRQKEECKSCGKRSYLTAMIAGSEMVFCRNCLLAHPTEVTNKLLRERYK